MLCSHTSSICFIKTQTMGIMHEQTRLLNNNQVYMQTAAKEIVVTVTAYSNFSPFVSLSEYQIAFSFLY